MLPSMLISLAILAPAQEPQAADNIGLQCVALAVFAEARGESWLGQAMVAQVIVNRAIDRRWPEPLCDVVEQSHQFHGIRDWPYPRRPWAKDPIAWRMALDVAQAVVSADYVPAPADCARATHFWVTGTPPPAGAREVCRVGRHTFGVESSA